MKKLVLVAVGALTLSSGAFAAEQHYAVWNAKDNTAHILQSANPNDIHPDWRGEAYVGMGQGFVPRMRKKTDTGLYLKGDLYSTRGSILNKNVWIIAKEWTCG